MRENTNVAAVPIRRLTVSSLTAGHQPLNETVLVQWLCAAAPGDQLAYHRGFLAIDTSMVASRLPVARREQLVRVAARVQDAVARGLARVLQRRNGENDFTYLLVACARPQTAGRLANGTRATGAVA